MNNAEFRTLRLKAGLTQARVAARAGIDHTRVCMWEKGNITLASEQILLLENALVELIRESADRMNHLLVEPREAV